MRSHAGVLLGEWPCTFTSWHRDRQIGQGWTTWVYTLVDELDRVAYVGQTQGLPKRLKQHADTKLFSWWYAFGTNDWRTDEAAQIQLCRPYLASDGTVRRSPWSSRVIHRDQVLAGAR